MQRFNNLPKLKERRKELRRDETKQENILWWHLKDRNLGYKFRRQYSVGGYILDFYCAEKKLGIEVDGGIHNSLESQEYDQFRDKTLKEFGIDIIRFSNSEVDKDVFMVLTKIQEKLNSM